MSGVSITGLNPASTLTGSEIVPIVQSGTTVRTTLAAMPYVPAGTGAVTTTVQAKLRETVSVFDFLPADQITYIKANNVSSQNATTVTQAFQNMFALGVDWYIPEGTYSINGSLTITSSGRCEGQLNAVAGFAGHLVDIVNPAYGVKLNIYGLNVYSTDVRPNPYTAALTIGIYIGPNATYFGNTPCPGVNLYGCRATRFSVGCWIGTFNVTCFSCIFPQNDHNCVVFTYDTSYNQVNDVSLINCDMNSASSSVGQAYALRVGTIGNGAYIANPSMGVNMLVQGCNFDGAPVYLDNILGITYQQNYHEQGNPYTYYGAALVIGSAGAASSQNIAVGNCYFTQFYYAIDVVTSSTNLEIKPNFYGNIAYSALRLYTTEADTVRYWNGVPGGVTDWAIGSGAPEVLTNFSAGTDISQVTFGGISISKDYLNDGSQVAPATDYTTNWYPYAITNNGYKNIASAYGRFRSGAAVQTSIAGTQSGNNFTFTTIAQAKLFNGGDRITASAGGAIWIKSVNYVAGTAVLNSSYTGSITISHDPVYFIGINITGAGTPEGVVTANPGSLYLNISGGASTSLYIKATGTGNTGWVAK